MNIIKRIKNLWRISGIGLEKTMTKTQNVGFSTQLAELFKREATIVDLTDPLDDFNEEK